MASKTWSSKVPVVGVAWNGSEAEMQGFVDKHALSFQNMNDQTGELFAHFEVPQQPAWVFVTAAGEFDTYLGALDEALMEKAFMTASGAA